MSVDDDGATLDDEQLFDLPQAGALATAVSGAALAAALAPFGPVGAGLGALLAPPAARVFQAAQDEWRHLQQAKTALLIETAAETAGMNQVDLLNEITPDAARLELLARTVQAAARTTLQGKIRCLGRALASGALASDDALIDEEQFFVAVIDDLEAPHLALLAVIAQNTVRPRGSEVEGISEQALSDSRPGLSGFGGTVTPLQPLIRILDRNGLIQQTATGAIWEHNIADDLTPGAGRNEWATTRFGEALLARLLEGGQDEMNS